MPNLEDFLGKNNKRSFAGWEPLYGMYGCQECDENVEYAFISPDQSQIVWVCPQEHESKIQLG